MNHILKSVNYTLEVILFLKPVCYEIFFGFTVLYPLISW